MFPNFFPTNTKVFFNKAYCGRYHEDSNKFDKLNIVSEQVVNDLFYRAYNKNKLNIFLRVLLIEIYFNS